MSGKPLISVIVPIFNCEKYLEECLKSIQNQTFEDFEVICVNDGSTDNSLSIIQKFQKNDNRFKILNQENQGLTVSRNNGLDIALGQYISFIDGDDCISPDFLSRLLSVQQETKADIVICNFVSAEKSMPFSTLTCKPCVFHNALIDYVKNYNMFAFNAWNKLFKREVIGKIRFPDLIYEDWLFNLFVFEQPVHFAYLNEKLYFYRITNTSIMHSRFTRQKQNALISGITLIYNHFKDRPKLWKLLQKTVIASILGTLIKNTFKTKDKNFILQTAPALRSLRQEKIISYKHLSLSKKLKLFYLLNLVR